MKVVITKGVLASQEIYEVISKDAICYRLENKIGNRFLVEVKDCKEVTTSIYKTEEQNMKVFCIVSGIGVTRGNWYEVITESPNYYFLQGGSIMTGVKKSKFFTFQEFHFLGLDEKDFKDDIDSKEALNNIYGYKDTDSIKDVSSLYPYGMINKRNTQLVQANEKFRTSTIKPELYNKLIKTKDLEWKEKVLLLAILNEEENRWK